MECAAKADDPNTRPEERKRLLKMREALLDLAETQDWLDGRKMPPTQQQQRRQRKTRPNATRVRRSGGGMSRSTGRHRRQP
ncbi:MAG: hypothetical protein K8F62_15865 [Pseudorhodoplanes sp.]|nr:hypothetical protein [Pseudorhodoplanes sp.]